VLDLLLELQVVLEALEVGLTVDVLLLNALDHLLESEARLLCILLHLLRVVDLARQRNKVLI
jgi:hypothetical protein